MKLVPVFLIVFTCLANASDEPELSEGPCNKLIEACKVYVKGAKEKKSLYRDCMKPLLNDQKIESLVVNAEDIKACKEKKAELKQKK